MMNFKSVRILSIFNNFNNNIKKYAFTKPDIGRWNTNVSKKDIDKKIDFANYDNCFTTFKISTNKEIRE